ncbi:hypothetical protein NDU88_000550 [Pleurodeles waltl]|uniref:Uncharacterized protein n=1 Tax=Pleurodeles waltl TaxID=8319 RepID=A0AAV7R6B7_PLEWA|nr:hypothetical protein NDU88_000550 [Pleurodeles waltl]
MGSGTGAEAAAPPGQGSPAPAPAMPAGTMVASSRQLGRKLQYRQRQQVPESARRGPAHSGAHQSGSLVPSAPSLWRVKPLALSANYGRSNRRQPIACGFDAPRLQVATGRVSSAGGLTAVKRLSARTVRHVHRVRGAGPAAVNKMRRGVERPPQTARRHHLGRSHVQGRGA